MTEITPLRSGSGAPIAQTSTRRRKARNSIIHPPHPTRSGTFLVACIHAKRGRLCYVEVISITDGWANCNFIRYAEPSEVRAFKRLHESGKLGRGHDSRTGCLVAFVG